MRLPRWIENLGLGIVTPLHVLACRLRRRRPAAPDADRDSSAILVVRCEAKIGDNLLHIPFLRALRRLYPDRPIHLLHHAAARNVYERCPYVDERIEFDWPMSAPTTFVRRLNLSGEVFRDRSTRYGLAVVPRWDEDLYAPFLAYLSGAPRTLGYARRGFEERLRNWGTSLLFTDIVKDWTESHESGRALSLLGRLASQVKEASPRLEFWFSAEDVRRVDELLPANSSELQWIAVAPGAAVGRRRWPLENFATVVAALARSPRVGIVFLGSAAESGDCASLMRACGGVAAMNLAGRSTLTECAALLARCGLFIGNDSGLLHLASAMSTPIVEVSCHPAGADPLHANSPVRFGPEDHRSSVVLRPPRPLSRSCRNACTRDDAHCITLVEPEGVLQAALSLLPPEWRRAHLQEAAGTPPCPHEA